MCMRYMNILCNLKEILHFSENHKIDNHDPRLTCDPMNEIEGFNLMIMYELHEYTREDAYSRTGGIFVRDTACDTACSL